MGHVETVQETLPAAGDDGEEPKVKFVDQVALDQRPVELAGAELQNVLAGLSLQLGHLVGDVPCDQRRVPPGLLQGG